MSWTVVGIIAIPIVVDLTIHVISAMIALPLFERELTFSVEEVPPDPDAEQFCFPTSGGLTLRGSLLRQSQQPARGLILFCPELQGNHWSARWYCEGLIAAGFDVISFDFRNQGESDHMPGYVPLHWLTEFEVEDVAAAIAYVRGRGDLNGLPLGLFGMSRGGAAALAATVRDDSVQCVACEGAFSTESLSLHFTLRWASLYAPDWLLKIIPPWHLRLTLALVRLASQFRRRCRYTRLERQLSRLGNRPVMMISGERDTYVLPEITNMLSGHIDPGCRSTWIVPGAKHNGSRQVAAEEYDQRIAEFFSQLPAVGNPEAAPKQITQPRA